MAAAKFGVSVTATYNVPFLLLFWDAQSILNGPELPRTARLFVSKHSCIVLFFKMYAPSISQGKKASNHLEIIA